MPPYRTPLTRRRWARPEMRRMSSGVWMSESRGVLSGDHSVAGLRGECAPGAWLGAATVLAFALDWIVG